MKKKLISMVVVSAMCLGMLAGCGKSSEPAEEPAPAEDSEPTEGSEPAADEEKPLRIAYSVQSLDNEYFVTICKRIRREPGNVRGNYKRQSGCKNTDRSD